MSNEKKISCRVCGKLFTPCSYCQSHADVFRWRNFACSKECAEIYINKAIAYRESMRKKNSVPEGQQAKSIEATATDEVVIKAPVTKKRANKKSIVEANEREEPV